MLSFYMSKLLLDDYAKYTRPISKPYNIFYNGQTTKDLSSRVLNDINGYINTIGTESYNLHYQSMANTDLAIDLLHVGMLYDREIHTNRIKRAANSDENVGGNPQRGAAYDVSNNIDELIIFPFTTETDPAVTSIDMTSSEYTISFTGGSTYTGKTLFKSKFSLSTDISLVFNEELKHWDVSYNNGMIEHADWICCSGSTVATTLLDNTNDYNWVIDQKLVLSNLYREISNNQGINWEVSDMSRGIVYIQQTGATDASYTFGFTNLYDTSATWVQTTEIDVKEVYWVDMINQYSLKKRAVANGTYTFDEDPMSNITQFSLVDLSYTDTDGNSQILTIENRPLNGGMRPLLDDISGYALSMRHDTSSNNVLKEMQKESITENKYLYDELYYGHDWSRVQRYDVSSSLEIVENFDTIYDLCGGRLSHEYDVDISRSSFDYKFPYLFYKCDDKDSEGNITDQLQIDIKIFYDTVTEISFNDLSFCDASSVIGTLNTKKARQEMKAGQYDFDGIDLMKCSVEMQESKFNSITKSPFVDISNLGLKDLPQSYLFKGYYYGYYDTSNAEPHYDNIDVSDTYLVFKFKEPSSYAENTQDISSDYLLFDPEGVYRENVPVGGNPKRSIFGLQTNYDASGFIIINADIAERLYIPIELKPKNVDIASSMSNNTNVFILDISVNTNKFLSFKTPLASYPTGKNPTKIIEQIVSPHLRAAVVSSSPSEMYFGVENKPVKYINGYDISDSLIGINENWGTFNLFVRPEPTSLQQIYSLNKESLLYYPLTGEVKTGLASQWFVGEETQIIETSFNSLGEDVIMLGYIVTKNQLEKTAYNSTVAKITDLSMALMAPNQGTKSYTYIPSYYFDEQSKKVLNPIRSRIDISNGLLDADNIHRIGDFNVLAPGKEFYTGLDFPNRQVTVNISPTVFNKNGNSKYLIPITLTKYPGGVTSRATGLTLATAAQEVALLAENHALDVTISAKHTIQTNNITIQTTDKASITFNLPYRQNAGEPIKETDLSFIIIGDISLGTIENQNDGSFCKFIPESQYLGGDNAFTDAVISGELHYKIVNNDLEHPEKGHEYIEWNNTITINIVNQYDTPEIFNRTYDIYKNEPWVGNLINENVFLIDDAYSNLEITDLIGPFHGKRTTNFSAGDFILTYDPDDNFIGVDYIFFKIKTSAIDGIKSREGHITFIVSEREPEAEPEPYIPTEYERCNCLPVAIVDSTIESAGNNPKITLAEFYSMRSINMRHYGKKISIIEMPKRAIINQNMRSSNNLRNF